MAIVATACSLPGAGQGGGEDVLIRENPFEPTDNRVAGDGDAPGFAVIGIDPARGPVTGGTRVEVTGVGFVPGSRVLFGGSEGEETVVEDETSIKTTTPPRAPGLVTISVRRPDGKVERLPDAFLYETSVQLDGVDPASGPASGGHPVTVRGRGIPADARLLIGGRLAQDVHVLDATTVIAVTPPGRPGPRDVLVVAPGAVGTLRKGYRYLAGPEPEGCSPTVVEVGTPMTVRIAGTGLADATTVGLPWGPAERFSVAGGDLEVVITAPVAGPADVTVTGPGGSATVPSCVRAVTAADLAAPTPRVLGVTPPFGPASGGGEAWVQVAGPAAGAAVTFNGATAPVLAEDPAGAALRVRVPAGTPGPVEVRVAAPSGQASLAGAYEYLPDLRVDAVSPPSGPASGGTLVTLAGSGLDRVTRVRIGSLPAALAGPPAADTLQVVTAPSSPGRRDIVLFTTRGERRVLPGGFVFGTPDRAIVAVSPVSGSTAGGTLVSVAGSGLEGVESVAFGDAPATPVDGSDPARLVLKTPPRADAGPADVTVRWTDGTTRTLVQGFTYFDPTGAFGGVWGEPVDGAVNVTVLDSYTSKRVPLAFVIVGSDAATTRKGRTDVHGQLTLSDEDLFGPVQVTAAREDYTTFTVAGVDAENVILFLDPTVPIPSGGGGGGKTLPPGTVSGRVLGADKFVLAPPTACEDRPLIHGTLCRSCSTDADCGADARCLDVAGRGLHCATGCVAESDCPEGYACYALAGNRAACLPSPGRPEVRCGTTMRSLYSFEMDPGPGYLPGPDGIYALNSRLGEVAVYCLGGVVAADGTFDPLVMGLNRHVGVSSATLLPGQDVRLDIPLDRELDVRLLDPPGGPGGPLDHVLTLALDLGSDGLLRLWPPQRAVDADHFVIRRLPRSFDGALEGATMTFLGEADSRTDDDVPYSTSVLRGWTPGQGNRVIEVGKSGSTLLAPDPRPDAMGGCPDPAGGGWVLAPSGRLFRVEASGAVSGSPSLGTVTMRGCAVRDGRLLAVGDQGWVVLRDANGNTREVTPTSRRLSAVAWADGEQAWAAGDGVLLHRDAGGTWTAVDGTGPQPLHAVVAVPGGALAFGAGGVVLRATATSAAQLLPWPADRDLLAATTLAGLPLVVGARGGAWIGDGAGNLSPLATPTREDLRTVVVTPDGTAVAAGARGTILRLGPDGFRRVSPPGFEGEVTTLLPGTGTTALALSTDAVTLGPFLKIPVFSSPPRSGFWTDLDLAWALPGPPVPSLTYTRVFGAKGMGDWTVVADGGLDRIRLPDLEKASGILAMPQGETRLEAYHILIDGFDIDGFDQTDLYSSGWRSWMVFRMTTTRP